MRLFFCESVCTVDNMPEIATIIRGGSVRRIRGPTQLKRHLEKQKELLEEARRMLLSDLEWLQVRSYSTISGAYSRGMCHTIEAV